MLRTRPWLLFLVALVLAGGCRCNDSGLGGARGDFRVEEAEVDFGRVLEGEQSRRTVTLVGTGRAGVTVTVATDSPFSVTEASVSVPGGGTVTLEVLFSAGSEPVEGTLKLTAASHTETVKLKAEGVRPLACVPTVQCHESHFELNPGLCVDTLAPDGTECIPTSRCEEQGRCQQGVCVGSPRRCDDDNPCTVDACSPTEGCVTTPVVCPQPADRCKVAVCRPSSGCGEENAADFTLCGNADCKSAELCIAGGCHTLPTPEGFVCAPATPCQDEGKCHSGECQRPDAGELRPAFSQTLGGVPVSEPGGPVLLVSGDGLYASVCSDDAGCGLVAFTKNGLLRFEAPYEDGGPRTLLTLSDAGVLMHEPASVLESYALASPGERQWQATLAEQAPSDTGLQPSTGAGRVALTAEGEAVALVSWRQAEDAGPDGGAPATLVLLDKDGGVHRSGPVEGFSGEGARVALGEQGAVLLSAEGSGRIARAAPEPEDGGTGFITEQLVEGQDDGGNSLAVAGGRLFAGARYFATTDGGTTDGGTLAYVSWDGGTQPRTPIDEPALLLDGVGYAFARGCPEDGGPPCTPDHEQLLLRALDAKTGATNWEVPVLPVDAPGTLYEASLVQGGAVGTLTDVALDGGPLAHVQLFARGERVAICSLKDRPHIAGAAHVGRFLYVVLERDGVWKLEAFDLGSFGFAETRGWPQRNGVSETRRAVP